MRGQASACDVLVPASLGEALDLLGREPGLRPLAGGTDLMVPFAAGKCLDTRFLNLWGLGELRGIEEGEKTLLVGALTTYAELQAHPLLRAEFPNLVASARATGAPAIQNRGTLGGNLVNGSPAADTPPSLLVYDADVELRSARGARWVSYADFHTGYKQNLLEPGELLTRILLRRSDAGAFHYFRKVGTRAAQAISKVAVAAHARAAEGVVTSFRLALGAVAPVPLRAREVEARVLGAPLRALPIAEAQRLLLTEIAPIDDLRSTAAYRRRVAANLVGDLLGRMARELGGA